MMEANSAYSVYNSFKELLVIFPSALTLAKLIKSNHPTLVNKRTNNIQRWMVSNKHTL